MTQIIRRSSIAALIGAAMTLAACGGGGTSTPAPITTKAATATPPPAAANRTAIGHATLSLVLPKVLHAKTAAKTQRAAQFIDPTTTPAANLIDIYVDGTFQPNLDGGTSGHSLVVSSLDPNGNQTVSLPIYSDKSNDVVVLEYDSYGSNLLAIGETNWNTFVAGTTQPVSIVLSMNATGLGVTDLGDTSNTVALSASPPGPALTLATCSSANVGFYPTDALNNFLPATGSGTGVGATATGVPLGSSTFSSSNSIAGVYTVGFDLAEDPVNVTATVANPAHAIYTDVLTTNYSNYSNGAYYGTNNGPNQGIYNLFFANYSVSTYVFDQMQNAQVTGYGQLAEQAC